MSNESSRLRGRALRPRKHAIHQLAGRGLGAFRFTCEVLESRRLLSGAGFTGLPNSGPAPSGAAGPGHAFYVNDGTVIQDDLTTAPGNDANSGIDTAHPKASIQAILNAYSLGAGDVINVDCGTYNLGSNIAIPASRSGVTIRGFSIAGNPSRVALISRNGTVAGNYGFELQGAANVTLEHLTITGGDVGVFAADNATSTGLTVSNCEIYGCADYGISLGSTNGGATISGNLVHDMATGAKTGIATHLDQVTITNNLVFNNARYGIDVEGGNNSTVGSNSAYSNGTGIVADTSMVTGNLVNNNLNVGITVSGGSTVTGNSTYHNVGGSPGAGIQVFGGTVKGNLSYGNTTGILVSGEGTISNNSVYSNTAVGISCGSGAAVSQNVIYSNGWGIQANVPAGDPSSFLNNLLYSNSTGGLQLVGGYNTPVVNNTIYQTAGDAFSLVGQANQTNVSLRNNIFWVTSGYDIRVDSNSQSALTSDYNDLYATATGQPGDWQNAGQSTLGSWQLASSQDADSISADPLFVNLSASNFHEQSLYGSYHSGSLAPVVNPQTGFPSTATITTATDANQSPAIDAGDGTSPYPLEPSPNGGYINLGAFGNTAQASRSPATYLRVMKPAGGETWSAGQSVTITWRDSGIGSGLVDIDLVKQSGNVMSLQSMIVVGTANGGQYSWNIPASIPPGGNYGVRVTMEGGATANYSGTFAVIATASPPAVSAFTIPTTPEGTAFGPVAGSFTGQPGDSFSATVDYGDGSGPQPLPLDGSTFALTHAYAQGGSYTVSVVVTDTTAGLASAPSTTSVAVSDVAIQAVVIGAPATISLGASVDLNFTATDPNALGMGPLIESWAITDDSNSVVASGTGGPYTFTPTATGTYTVTFTAGESAAPDAETGTAIATITVTPLAPHLASTVIGDGTAQRSVFNSFTLNFDEAVNLAAGAVTVNKVTTGGVSTDPHPILTSTDVTGSLTIINPSGDGKAWVVKVTPDGSVDDGFHDFLDGVYTYTLHAASITNSTGITLSGGDQTASFLKRYGDIDGDGLVGNIDFGRFKTAFGNSAKTPPTNTPAFDIDHDGTVGNIDFGRFKSNFIKPQQFLPS
jgi:parallel beta-helix repeat protein